MLVKNNILLVCLVALSSQELVAQDSTLLADTSYWVKKAQLGFGFNQASFSDNWRAGGINSIAVVGFFNGNAQYAKEKISWDNSIRLEYGSVKNKGLNLRKNTDRILIDSKFGYQLSKNWNAFTSLNFLSQFDAGFEYQKAYKDAAGVVIEVRDNLISRFLAPGFLTESAGVEFRPVKYFWARCGLASMR